MRKLILFYASQKEIDENKINYLIRDTKNSLIDFSQKDGKTYFHSLYSLFPEEIIIEHLPLVYNEELVRFLEVILDRSYEYSKTISNDEATGPFDKPEIFSEIQSYIYKCSYSGNEPETIFHFVAELFYKYASGHKMKNGNKRLTFMFMINMLRYFGYHFYWTKGKEINYKRHEKEIALWVEKSHNLSGDKYKEYIDELANWIKSNCTIALEWRK